MEQRVCTFIFHSSLELSCRFCVMLTLTGFKRRLQIHICICKEKETKDDIHASLVLADGSRNMNLLVVSRALS